MMKASVLFLLIFIVIFSSFAQVGEICKWNEDKKATVVLTFDDWSPGHYPIVVPALRSRGMVATFFPMISSIASWNHPWPDVIETVSYGNEMGNHSFTHPNLPEQDAKIIGTEIRDAKAALDDKLSEQSVISFDYPFGAYNDEVIDSVSASGHIAARGVNFPSDFSYSFATKEKDYFELKSVEMNEKTSTKEFSRLIDQTIAGGGLLIYMYHSVDDAEGTHNDNWYAQVLADSLQLQLDALFSYEKEIWVTTLGQAIKYHRQANCATLSEIKAYDGEHWIVELTDTLSNSDRYNQPLSLKLKMNGVNFNKITQNGKQVAIDSVFNDTILFKAIPDGGQIILSVVETTGINERFKGDLKIFPCPSNGLITVESAFLSHEASIRIYNLQGQMVASVNSLQSHGMQIDLSHLKPGIYYLNLMANDTSLVDKIVIS